MAVYVRNGNIILQSVSYVQPVFSASYLQVQIEAVVTMPDVLAVDIIDPTDDLSLSFSKALTDTYSDFEEIVSKSTLKSPSDTITMVDDTDIDVWIEKILTELQVISDSDKFDLSKKVPPEVVTAIDLLAKQYNKKLVDSLPGFTDTTTRSFGKKLTDSVLMEDDTDIDVWIQKVLTDIQATTDKRIMAFTKAPFLEAIGIQDVRRYVLTKALSETINTPLDTTARVINKVLKDSVSITDVVTAFKLYIRNFSDSVSVPDDGDNLVISQPKTETASATDASFRGVNKPFVEGITLIDGMDGDLDFSFIKVVSELVAPLDAKVVDFRPTKADNVLTSSSGILAMQDYCDITYFLEDYVGTSRSFT